MKMGVVFAVSEHNEKMLNDQKNYMGVFASTSSFHIYQTFFLFLNIFFDINCLL